MTDGSVSASSWQSLPAGAAALVVAPQATAPLPLVRLLHLASTMLPVGAFSYSQGLEWAVESGTITRRAAAEDWIFDCMRWSLGRFEAPLLVAAQRAWRDGDDARAENLNRRMAATRETRELLAETVQMGYSLRQWCGDAGALNAGWLERVRGLDAPTYPVLFAAVAAAWEIDPRATLTVYLWSWLENQVGAAMKAIPLGQSDGQRILLAAQPVLAAVVEQAWVLADAPLEQGWSTQCPGLAIASSCHEAQYSRLFRS